MFLKFNSDPWVSWFSYTLSESKRWDDFRDPYRFEYDQTHNANLVVGRDLSSNWRISGRYRFVTGNPYTPVDSAVFDSDNDVYIPQRGALFSKRVSDFHQLDLRIDKKWILDEEIWSVYLDIQNLLNRQNTEQIQFSYDYATTQEVMGLPILPALGVKGEF